MIELKDEELLLRLKKFEDNFVERKTSGDSKDWLKTVVAFANSTPVGYPAVLYIGVKNDGTPEEKPVNLDTLQKTFGGKIVEAYPTIYYLTKILTVEGKQILVVIVPGSDERPHFAGQAFVREGSRSVVASKPQFDELIASRNSKAYEILKWKGKPVSVDFRGIGFIPNLWDAPYTDEYTIVDCNQFYVTLTRADADRSVPLSRVEISFDDKSMRLKLDVVVGPHG
jgi:hypothetical protein